MDILFPDFTTAHSWNVTTQAKTAEAVRRSIEQCFQDYDSVKEYLTIDRLDLDLGAFSAGQLISEMPEKLYQELQKRLGSYRMDVNDFEEAEIVKDASSINIWPAPNADNKMVSPIVKKSEVAAFLFFLQHGYLPWWYSNEPAWGPEWLKKLTGENWRKLQNFLTAYQGNEGYYERAVLRLIAQFSDEFLASLLNRLQLKEPVEKAWSWLEHFYITMQKTETAFHYAGSLPSLSILRKHFWKKWLEYTLGRSAIPGLTNLLAPVKQTSIITSFLSEIVNRNEWMDRIPGFWRNELISSKSGSGINVELINHTESERFKEAEKVNPVAEDDFILIPDAGLVLLHPFLPRLFEYCHWLNKNEFLNDEAKNRAVYALHYLAAGDEEAPEYVLMLPKLLCGISLEDPLNPVLPLTDDEKAACDELLVQVIGHWSALGNTSPAGLRGTFLGRQGKLFSTGEGWRVEVQRKTEDILLNRLPWGFSMIKFSWMPRLLSISWE